MGCSFNIKADAITSAQEAGRVAINASGNKICDVAKYNKFIGFIAYLFNFAVKCEHTIGNVTKVIYVNANSFAKHCQSEVGLTGNLKVFVDNVKKTEAAKAQNEVIKHFRDALETQLKKSPNPEYRQAQLSYYDDLTRDLQTDWPFLCDQNIFEYLLHGAMRDTDIPQKGLYQPALHHFAGFDGVGKPDIDTEKNIFKVIYVPPHELPPGHRKNFIDSVNKAKAAKAQKEVIEYYRTALETQLKKSQSNPEYRQAQLSYYDDLARELQTNLPFESDERKFAYQLHGAMRHKRIIQKGPHRPALHHFAGFHSLGNPDTVTEKNIFKVIYVPPQQPQNMDSGQEFGDEYIL